MSSNSDLNSKYCEFNFLRFLINNVLCKLKLTPKLKTTIKLILDNCVARRIEKWQCCLKRVQKLNDHFFLPSTKINVDILNQLILQINSQLHNSNIIFECIVSNYDADRVIYDEIYKKRTPHMSIVLSIDSDFFILDPQKTQVIDYIVAYNSLSLKNQLIRSSLNNILWLIGMMMPNDFKTYDIYDEQLVNKIFNKKLNSKDEYFDKFIDYLKEWCKSKCTLLKKKNFLLSLLYNCCIDPFKPSVLYSFVLPKANCDFIECEYFVQILHFYSDNVDTYILENEKKFKSVCTMANIQQVYVKNVTTHLQVDLKIGKLLFLLFNRLFDSFYPLEQTNYSENTTMFNKFADFFVSKAKF